MRMNESLVVCAVLLLTFGLTRLFIHERYKEKAINDGRMERRSPRFVPENHLVSLSGQLLKRNRRGLRSYFYNYLDEIAMGICGALPSEGPGLNYAVRRTCGDNETLTCKQICTDPKLRSQGPKEVQSLTWSCSESIHVYKRQPALADNYEEYTDSYKLGLAVYRHNSCTVAKCGPNYCCCQAIATTPM